MNKSDVKQIKKIAEQLPPVAEQARSGTNVYTVPVNHERRLRKAYEKLGMLGIERYLDWIRGLQDKRKEQLENEKKADEQGQLSEGTSERVPV